jgi:hypothetical protein
MQTARGATVEQTTIRRQSEPRLPISLVFRLRNSLKNSAPKEPHNLARGASLGLGLSLSPFPSSARPAAQTPPGGGLAGEGWRYIEHLLTSFSGFCCLNHQEALERTSGQPERGPCWNRANPREKKMKDMQPQETQI